LPVAVIQAGDRKAADRQHGSAMSAIENAASVWLGAADGKDTSSSGH
jgi:hypothetical protein